MKKQFVQFGSIICLMAVLSACQKEDQVKRDATGSGNTQARQAVSSNYPEPIPAKMSQKPGMLEARGDGMNGLISFGDITSSCIGIYSEDGGTTYFSMRSEDGTSIAGVFNGKSTGHHLKGSSMTLMRNGKTYVADQQICIHISAYGERGEKIRGSFSGTFRRYDVDEKSGKRLEFKVQVLNGHFEVKRLPNQ